jgi:uncharacterized protein (DUF58 family)
MNALLLALFLDLTAAHAAPKLALEVSAPKSLTAGKMTPIRVTLRNQGTSAVRVVAEDCARAPFAVLVDGNASPVAAGCDDRFVRAIDLAPGASVSDEVVVALPRGKHRIEARYQADPPGDKSAFVGPLRSEAQIVSVNVAVMEVDY